MICSRMLEGQDCEECEDRDICPISMIEMEGRSNAYRI